MRSWPDLLWQPIPSRVDRDLVEAGIAALTVPAAKNWILARVAALLTAYYAADVPAQIVQFEAEDWADALAEFPDWAITKAVRFWKGEENPDRRKRPMVGDIAARARFEMGAVVVARRAVKWFDAGNLHPMWPPQDPPRVPPTPEEMEHRRKVAAELLAGFKAKTFGDTQ